MNHTTPEWEGLETFVDEVRRLEAPDVRHSLPPVAAVPKSVGASQSRRWMIGGVGVFIAGVAATLVVVARRDGADARATTRSGGRVAVVDSADSASRPPAAGEIAGLLSPWPRLAYAQTPERMPTPYPPVRLSGTERLRASQRVYVRLSANAYHDFLPHGSYTEVIDTARLMGIRTWRVVQSSNLCQLRDGSVCVGSTSSDSLWLDATSLRPLRSSFGAGQPNQPGHTQRIHRYTATSDSLEFRLHVRAEDLRITTKANRDGKYVVIPSGRALDSSRLFVPTEAAMDLLLRALPLREGWKGSVSVPPYLSIGGAAGKPLPLNMRVAGVDTVQLFNGRFPTWRVILETGPKPDVWHVSQETGEVLLVEDEFTMSYPTSRRYLMAGLQATQKAPPVRRK